MADTNLVIVESPAKARTLERFLGQGYRIRASAGHVRDLPKSGLGVEVEKDFQPEYIIVKEKQSIINDLKKAAQGVTRVFLATDPDREGEAISWHLMEAVGLKKKAVKRVVFHEITEEAVTEAFKHPRDIDMELVNAQQARRVLDRLVGYKISPLLWRKVQRGLSAGRVQSVALRMIVDRERDIRGFVPREYWSIDAELIKHGKHNGTAPESFTATLQSRVGDDGKLEIPDQAGADRLLADLRPAHYKVQEIKRRQVTRQPAPPFITSTLQQEAWRKLQFSARQTMTIAQQLYEGLPLGREGSVGLITYMRTDSTNVAASALAATRDYIAAHFGKEYVPARPRVFKKKAKGAQEAHEAIRPTSVTRTPEQVRRYLNDDQYRLYDLIWKRMLASQMAEARYDSVSVDVEASRTPSGASYLLRTTSSVLVFPGFLSVYQEDRDDEEADGNGHGAIPTLRKGEALDLLDLLPKQHFTQPPARYTEASLVKALEENGIGRPSTYAAIISTLLERKYVRKESGRLLPEELGGAVSDFLVAQFPEIMGIQFTAQMEEELDEIARGERPWVLALREFYGPFEESVTHALENAPRVKVPPEQTNEVCELCGRPMVIRQGRFGRFMACSGYPECKNTKPIQFRIGVACPECGGELLERKTKGGRSFYGCSNYPRCQFTSWRRPVAQRCPQCQGMLVAAGKNRAQCLSCATYQPLPEAEAPATPALVEA